MQRKRPTGPLKPGSLARSQINGCKSNFKRKNEFFLYVRCIHICMRNANTRFNFLVVRQFDFFTADLFS